MLFPSVSRHREVPALGCSRPDRSSRTAGSREMEQRREKSSRQTGLARIYDARIYMEGLNPRRIDGPDPEGNGNELDRRETVYKQTRRRPRVHTSALGAAVHAIVRQRGGRPVIRGLPPRHRTHHFPGSYWPSRASFHSTPVPAEQGHRYMYTHGAHARVFVQAVHYEHLYADLPSSFR